MKQEIEIGNVIVLRGYEPEMRMTAIVTGVDEGFITCIMLKMTRRRNSDEYQFYSLDTEYIFDPKRETIEVLQLPGELVEAACSD